MSLENATVAESPASGQETAPAAPETSNENTSRYEGFSSPDVQEPVEANQGEQTQEATTEPTPETPEVPEGEGAENVETPDAEPDPWADYEDIEVDGKVLKVPKEAKDYLLRQADYTRKTQAVAVREKELDAREQQITQRQQLSDQEIDAQLALITVGSKLKEFEGINWSAKSAEFKDDPIALGELNAKWMEFQELRGLHSEGTAYLNNAAQQRTEIAQQETAKRLAATKAFAEKNIKGWTPALDHQITTWAEQQGFTRDMLLQAYNPQVYSTLHKAFLWDQSLQRQQSAKPSPLVPQTPVKPTPSVTAKANAAPTFDPETASMSDYEKDWAARQKRR